MKLGNDEVIMIVFRIVLRIVQGWPYNKFYKPTKDYAKLPIYQFFKFSLLELFINILLFINISLDIIKLCIN
jgi:hypothetical protein